MCLFCGIVEKKIASRIVFEDDRALAFKDVNPQAPTHILIIPKQHLVSLNSIAEADREIMGHLFYLAQQIAKEQGIDKSGYRTVINTGKDAGQSVFHLHLHLLGGRPMAWPPG
jgi:histidine triad (HIT) family protein